MSGSRVILAAIWVCVSLSTRTHSGTLVALSASGAASDILDGFIARWMQTSSQFGRWLDSTADATFILSGLACKAYTGVIPYYVPALVAASFTQYVLDSVLIRGSTIPVKSRLGHWAGIFNYLFLMLLAWTSGRTTEPLLHHLSPFVALFYLAAMLERAKTYQIARTSTAILSSQ